MVYSSWSYHSFIRHHIGPRGCWVEKTSLYLELHKMTHFMLSLIGMFDACGIKNLQASNWQLKFDENIVYASIFIAYREFDLVNLTKKCIPCMRPTIRAWGLLEPLLQSLLPLFYSSNIWKNVQANGGEGMPSSLTKEILNVVGQDQHWKDKKI